MPPRLCPALILAAVALGLPAPRAAAHPLFRVHVRPSAYRVAMPRLPHLPLSPVVRQVAGLVPQAASLTPQATALSSAASLGRAAAGSLGHLPPGRR